MSGEGPKSTVGLAGSTECVARLSDALNSADYTELSVANTVECSVPFGLSLGDLPPILRRTRSLSPHETLVRAFLLGQIVPEDSFRAALQDASLESLAEAGLLRLTPEGVEPLVRLTPFADLILASNLPRPGGVSSADFVMPPGLSSLMLSRMRMRQPFENTLDLGTGCGVLGLSAAGHSERVIATDANPRALEFFEFNAKLNSIENAVSRQGSLYDPVSAEQFHLIISNPPFVISPSQKYQYRDGGMRGDEFCRQLIRSTPEMLRPGGVCQLMCNIAHPVGGSLDETFSEWVDGLPCDSLVWINKTSDISEYAMRWILASESQDPDFVPQLYDEWMDYFERERIEAVSDLLLTMRRSDGPHWLRIDDAPAQILNSSADEIRHYFDHHHLYESMNVDDSLMKLRLVLAPDAWIQQDFRVAAGESNIQLTLQRHRVHSSRAELDESVFRLLSRCTGQQTVAELITAAAAERSLDIPQVVGPILKTVHNLVERGMLIPLE